MNPPRGLEIVLALFLMLALSVVSTSTSSAPKAASQQECLLLADYALTSRALVAANVDEQKRAATLGTMYVFPDKRVQEIAAFVRRAAAKTNLSPQDFAMMLFTTCRENQGDMDNMLGGGTAS